MSIQNQVTCKKNHALKKKSAGKWNIEAQEPYKTSDSAQNRFFGFKWCTGENGCCEKGQGDCDKNKLDHYSFLVSLPFLFGEIMVFAR